jgi:hypothetical protein
MTVPERLSIRHVDIQSSRRRAPARIGEVRSSSDGDLRVAHPNIQKKPAISYATGVRHSRTVALLPCSAPLAFWHALNPHS